jgi:hypothetical protein
MGEDEHVAHHHPVNRTRGGIGLMTDAGLEGASDAGEEGGVAVTVAPDIDVEACVVALEELAVTADPLAELLEREAAWGEGYKPVLVSI